MEKKSSPAKKKPIGRPPLDPENRKTDYLDVRFSPAEMLKIREIAAKNGGLSAWVRARLGL
jgi:hypothetical protein